MTAGEAIALARLVEPDVAFIDLQLLDGPTGIFVAQHLRGAEKTLFVFITANATRLPSDTRAPQASSPSRSRKPGSRRRSAILRHAFALLRRTWPRHPS